MNFYAFLIDQRKANFMQPGRYFAFTVGAMGLNIHGAGEYKKQQDCAARKFS